MRLVFKSIRESTLRLQATYRLAPKTAARTQLVRSSSAPWLAAGFLRLERELRAGWTRCVVASHAWRMRLGKLVFERAAPSIVSSRAIHRAQSKRPCASTATP